MTGKQLKEFAAKVSDESIIENYTGYGSNWVALDPIRLRAVYQCPSPVEQETHEHL